MNGRQKPGQSAVFDAPIQPEADLRSPELYANRELSLLAFQQRVLDEAQDEGNPLLERLKFLSIVGSNLDEFFMVRVAGLEAQVEAKSMDLSPDGMTPEAQLISIRREVKKLMADALRCWSDHLRPQLADEGIEIADYAALDERQCEAVTEYFRATVYPVLTPLAYDPGRPFPHVSNLSLNLAITIQDDKGHEKFARLKIPPTLPQFVPLNKAPAKRKQSRKRKYVLLEQVIAANLGALFPGMRIVNAHPFRVTRDSDLDIRELEAEDLLESVEEGVRQRRFGSVVRLEVTDDMPEPMLDILRENFEIEKSQIYRTKGVLGLSRLMELTRIERPELHDAPFLPSLPAPLQNADDEDIFAVMGRGDILLHHPFDSFQPVVDFVRKAARDPHVLAIKMTLYRVGRNSPIVEALMEAMENGKQVAVLVELKARFDEESNIEWARALERVGVHVVYGLVGLKIHCKTLMVVRREGEVMRRYVHVATGNYNVVTSHVYTDIGVLTANEEIAQDVTDLFNFLTGYSAKSDYRTLLVAPVNLRSRLEALIQDEIENAKAGKQAHLIFKVNALADPPLIRSLYRASQAGVRVDLLVRGVCCLRPGVPGVSDNISVTSVVGRLLEHSRIYWARNGGNERMLIGSADLLPRNLNRRVEVLMAVRSPDNVRELKEVLALYQADTAKARQMRADGTYHRPDSAEAFNVQEFLIGRARSAKRPGH